jgi:hypothetical protein
MKRWSRKVCTASLLGSLLLSVGSCANNENMLVIIGAMTASPPGCVYTATASATLLLSGTVDLAFGGYYQAVLLVSNQLMAEGSKSRLRAESSNVSINNAEVRLLANGVTPIMYNSVPASGFIGVGAGEDSGYGSIAVEIMPGGLSVPANTGYIVAEVRLQCKTSGGDDIESNLFRYDIYVVDSRVGGGLVRYNGVNGTGVEICDAAVCNSGTSTTTTDQSCYEGQDSTMSCCDCIGRDFCQVAP